MRLLFRAAVPFLLGVALLLQGCGGSDSGEVTAEQAYAVGLQAYVWGYPLVSNSNRFARLSTVTDLRVVNHTLPQAPINRICFLSDYVTVDERSVVAPNHDTVYGSAWLDLGAEPIVIRIPDMGDRYWIFQITDFYTDVIASPGSRRASPAGNYLVVGPGWNGEVPPGIVEVIRAPTRKVYCLPRILLKGESDLPNVLPLINRITVAPLSQMDTAPTYVDYAAVTQVEAPNLRLDFTPDDTYWDTLHTAILETELRPGEEAMVATFLAVINQRSDPAVRAALAAALAEGKRRIEETGSFGRLGVAAGNGWVLIANSGRFGRDYFTRAGVINSFIYCNLLEDAAYYTLMSDAGGNPLDGARGYRIHFEAANLPPHAANAFWSITLYGSDCFLVPNPIDRYNIGTVTEGLRYNADGSLDIYLQSTPPSGHETNWLPTPASEAFELALRVYVPGESILNNSYVPPAVVAVP
jgi:hypothetical protein